MPGWQHLEHGIKRGIVLKSVSYVIQGRAVQAEEALLVREAELRTLKVPRKFLPTIYRMTVLIVLRTSCHAHSVKSAGGAGGRESTTPYIRISTWQ